MADVVVGLILVALVASAVCYLVRAKKRGQTCIGCPDSGKCGGGCGCSSPDGK